jgi:hypothetical protein
MAVGRFDFINLDGPRLAAWLDRPPGEPVAYALFAHRFTCRKVNLAASPIAHALASRGADFSSPLPISWDRPAGRRHC